MKAQYFESTLEYDSIKRVTITCPLHIVADFIIAEARTRGLLKGDLECQLKYYDEDKDAIIVTMEKCKTERAKEIE